MVSILFGLVPVIRLVVVIIVSKLAADKLKGKLDNNWLHALASVSVGHIAGVVVVFIGNLLLGGHPSFGLWVVPVIGNVYNLFTGIRVFFSDFSLFRWYGFFYTIVILLLDILFIITQLVTLALIPMIANQKENSGVSKSAKLAPGKICVCKKCGCEVGVNDTVCKTCGADLVENKPLII